MTSTIFNEENAPSGTVLITTRYVGRCRLCGGLIKAGEEANFNRGLSGSRVWHLDCTEGGKKTSAIASLKARLEEKRLEQKPLEAKDTLDVLEKANLALENSIRAIGWSEDASKAAAEAKAAFDAMKEAFNRMSEERGREIVLRTPESQQVKNLGAQHASFPLLLKAASAKDFSGNRLNIWLTGPAGTGKTTAAQKVAEALELPFFFTGAIDTEYKLLGFVDASGRVVSRPFREAWTNGGVFLKDEVDGSHPSALLALNAALANGVCDFPDGAVKRHPDFLCIAAANTWGQGATVDYVGRTRLDAASLDRFVQIPWELDEDLERATAPNAEWCAFVQKIRENLRKRGLQGVMITPRATYYGSALLAAGLDWNDVVNLTLRKGMSKETWSSLQ